MDKNLNSTYWENRYQEGTSGWDLGKASTPIKEYIDQLNNKDIKILIPGAGNSYEAEYLFRKGFKNVYVADLAHSPLENLKSRISEFPSSQLLHTNFFDIEMKFDLIIEQTFFCAIDPKLRGQYVTKASELLKKDGKLVGLLFDAPLYQDHPPFGGDKQEYLDRFSPYFVINTMETATNSVNSRAGRELFINLTNKAN
ncbi:MAG: methyltransferase domain-containing protein [bacterium]